MCQHEDGLFRGRELVPRQLGTASASLGLTFPTAKTQEKHPVLYHRGLQVTQSENLWLTRKSAEIIFTKVFPQIPRAQPCGFDHFPNITERLLSMLGERQISSQHVPSTLVY